MVDFVGDPNQFQILRITVSCSAFDGGLFVCLNTVKPARCKRYFHITNRNKRSVFLLTDHFVIEECKLLISFKASVAYKIEAYNLIDGIIIINLLLHEMYSQSLSHFFS